MTELYMIRSNKTENMGSNKIHIYSEDPLPFIRIALCTIFYQFGKILYVLKIKLQESD